MSSSLGSGMERYGLVASIVANVGRGQMLRDHVKPHIGHLRMEEVTETDLQRLYRSLVSAGSRKRGKKEAALSGPSIWTCHNIIRAMFTFAVEVQQDFDRSPGVRRLPSVRGLPHSPA